MMNCAVFKSEKDAMAGVVNASKPVTMCKFSANVVTEMLNNDQNDAISAERFNH